MSTAQSEAIHAWTKQGGCLVFAGEAITLNGTPISELTGLGKEHPVVDFGEGKIALWDGDEPTVPTPTIAPTDGLARNLRFAVYRQGDRRALHAVNYNVCLLDEARQVLDVGPTPIELPVPAAWKAAQATCYDPDAEAQTIECTVADGRARFTLPKTRVYKIVLLEGNGP